LILVTGAGGKTGRSVLRELARQNRPARALVRDPKKIPMVLAAGATEASIGNLLEPQTMEAAFEGISHVYHIPPNMHEEEEAIGENVLRLAEERPVEHFVYHSVLHPYVRAMPHHLKKARVEEMVFISDLPFTIMQPEAYMQNYIPGLAQARSEGIFPVPYPADTLLGIVDLEDIARAATAVLGRPEHYQATYELAGGECWTPQRMAETMGEVLKRPVRVVEIDRSAWARQALQSGMNRYQRETLQLMFDYYSQYGFWGNSTVLERLLGHAPKTFREFLVEQERSSTDAG
jgi:uncharacterized protein YbjT (DUF2867 family)